uniref:C-type lectin domain-containing protein n=1 Tax=Otus sunia TaxID=257818 RepID=A0A8C8EFS5_9STRI
GSKKCQSCPFCPSPALPSCPEEALGYRLKCFYFVEKETDWNTSQSFCLSLRANLTTIDSPEELDFLLRYGQAIHLWVGLRREGSAPWKWLNGSFFNTERLDPQAVNLCGALGGEGAAE